MAFFKQTENRHVNKIEGDNADFVASLAYFSLAHTELYSFLSIIKIKELAQRTHEITSISQNMAAMSDEIAASVQQINSSMQAVSSGAEESVNRMEALFEQGKHTESVLMDMIHNTEELSGQVKNIDNITQGVSDIADQTNLLALNAAIEAARAGDAGKGFNVVAEEVRKLAAKTKQAVGNVKQISDNMNTKSARTFQNVNDVKDIFERYIDNSGAVNKLIQESGAHVGECATMVENITNATEENTATAEKLSDMAEELSITTDFVINLLTRESNYLGQIISPSLKISDSGTTVNTLANKLVDHANFLKKTISEAGNGTKVTNHHECAFGKWYDENKERYGYIEAFKEIDEPHRKVHEYGQKLANDCTSQNIESLMHASTDILKAFIKLRDALRYK